MVTESPSVDAPRPAGWWRSQRVITLERFQMLEAILRADGYGHMIAWSESLAPPRDARTFAKEAIYVICNSGMKVTVASLIYQRCLRALRRRESVSTVFGHVGKARAIDHIWQHRKILFAAYLIADNKVAFCATLPWIGPVTSLHLAKNLGVDVVKPDVHLSRLAKVERITAAALCQRLAEQTGYRLATIDTILWRACADKVLDSAVYLTQGWDAAFEAAED